jgi:nucleoside-diphosphate-sugar epimerase
MKIAQSIVAITGGSGMVGQKLTQKLVKEGHEVRVLTRNKSFRNGSANVYYGDIEDTDVLQQFLKNASYLFHCAAELHDETRMWDVNVSGTERILSLIPSSGVTCFCHLSSVGVIGLTDNLLVDEESKCNPQNTYEKSKWAAEQLVSQGIDNCHTVILRPTNVIDEQRPGTLALPIRGNWLDRLMVFLKGGECSYIVHAEDVADAAIYLMGIHLEKPECYIVSCDHERLNTYAGLWSLYNAIREDRDAESVRPAVHMPIFIPYILRRLIRGATNYGNVRYSSEKLLSTGFRYHLGVEGAVRSIAASQHFTLS